MDTGNAESSYYFPHQSLHPHTNTTPTPLRVHQLHPLCSQDAINIITNVHQQIITELLFHLAPFPFYMGHCTNKVNPDYMLVYFHIYPTNPKSGTGQNKDLYLNFL